MIDPAELARLAWNVRAGDRPGHRYPHWDALPDMMREELILRARVYQGPQLSPRQRVAFIDFRRRVLTLCDNATDGDDIPLLIIAKELERQADVLREQEAERWR